MIPRNKLPQANATNAELGMEKSRLAGYINGIDAKLFRKEKFAVDGSKDFCHAILTRKESKALSIHQYSEIRCTPADRMRGIWSQPESLELCN